MNILTLSIEEGAVIECVTGVNAALTLYNIIIVLAFKPYT